MTFPTGQGETPGIPLVRNAQAKSYTYLAPGGEIVMMDESSDVPTYRVRDWKLYFFLGIKAATALANAYDQQSRLELMGRD